LGPHPLFCVLFSLSYASFMLSRCAVIRIVVCLQVPDFVAQVVRCEAQGFGDVG
jgi:hypothetical protein